MVGGQNVGAPVSSRHLCSGTSVRFLLLAPASLASLALLAALACWLAWLASLGMSTTLAYALLHHTASPFASRHFFSSDSSSSLVLFSISLALFSSSLALLMLSLLATMASLASLALSPIAVLLLHHTAFPAASRHFFPCKRGGSGVLVLLVGPAVLSLWCLATIASLASLAR